MDFNFTEWLAPILFIALWVISRILTRNREEGEPSHRSPEAEKRARRIREEIQRRISERQQRKNEEPPPAPRPATPVPSYEAPGYEPPPLPETEPAPAFPRTKTILIEPPLLLEEDPGGPTAWIEQKEAWPQLPLEKKPTPKSTTISFPQARVEKKPLGKLIGSTKSHFFQKEVVRSLRNPSRLRKAFIYAEVLGVPMSLRRRQDFLQFWEH